MFTKEDRGTFRYWFAHWCAYQMTALNLKCWKPRFLLHDIKKPFQMIWHDYDYAKVQAIHRKESKHHLTYWTRRDFSPVAFTKLDLLGMIIDWECSRLTKQQSPMTARETLDVMVNQLQNGGFNSWSGYYSIEPLPEQISAFKKKMTDILNDLGL